MKKDLKIPLLLLLLLLIYMLGPQPIPAVPKASLRRETVYTLLFNVSGDVTSSEAETVITFEPGRQMDNITVIAYEPEANASTLNMLAGPAPTETVAYREGVKLVWRGLSLKQGESLTIKYRIMVRPVAPMSPRGWIGGRGLLFNPSEYLIKNASKGGIFRVKVDLVYESGYRREVLGEETRLPYPAVLVFTYPKSLLEVTGYSSEPNATSSQEDKNVLYWNMLLSANTSLEITMRIASLGAWRTIWIPPVILQVDENPDAVIGYIRKAGLGRMLNETTESYKFLEKTRERLAESLSELEYMAETFETIGEMEIRAASSLKTVSHRISTALEAVRQANLTAENVERLLTEARAAINQTIRYLEAAAPILGNFTPPGEEYTVTNLTGILRRAERNLSQVSGEDVEQALKQAEKTTEDVDEAQRYLVKAGSMHLKLARKIRSEYRPSLEKALNEINSKLGELKQKIDELNRTYLKMKAVEEMAAQLKAEHENLTKAYVDGDEYGQVETKIKYVLLLKLPTVTSKFAGLSGGAGAGEETGGPTGNPLILGLLVSAIAAALLFLGRRRRETGGKVEAVKVEKLEEEVDELIRELEMAILLEENG